MTQPVRGYGAEMAFWRRNQGDDVVVLGDPLPVPKATVDGWTLAGTPLGHLRGDASRELATHLHGIELGVETPWTYLRTAELLEECGFPRMALTALDAWLSHPLAGARMEETKLLERHRAKLHTRLARVVATESVRGAHGAQESP